MNDGAMGIYILVLSASLLFLFLSFTSLLIQGFGRLVLGALRALMMVDDGKLGAYL